MNKVSPEDLKKLKERAESGDADAQCKLGMMHLHGDGVPKHGGQANLLLNNAARNGNTQAMVHLGKEALSEGNYPIADLWLRQAALEKGNAEAQFHFGTMCENGHYVSPDKVRAYALYNMAAAHGHKEARAKRDALAENMSEAEISEAQSLSARRFAEINSPSN